MSAKIVKLPNPPQQAVRRQELVENAIQLIELAASEEKLLNFSQKLRKQLIELRRLRQAAEKRRAVLLERLARGAKLAG